MKKKRAIICLLLISTIFILSFIYSECVENWVCETWSECNLDGIKSRICNETNQCNTTTDKPSLKKVCGENCLKETTCKEWNSCINGKQTRFCYNTNTCGAAEERVLEWQYCQEPLPPINLTNNSTNQNNQSENLTEETQEEEVNNSWCDGCVLEGECLAHGTRLEYLNQSRYCDSFDNKVKTQRLRNLQGKLVSCKENYECKSNVCANNTCVDIQEIKEEITASATFISKFLCRISALFKISEYNVCLFNKMNEEE